MHWSSLRYECKLRPQEAIPKSPHFQIWKFDLLYLSLSSVDMKLEDALLLACRVMFRMSWTFSPVSGSGVGIWSTCYTKGRSIDEPRLICTLIVLEQQCNGIKKWLSITAISSRASQSKSHSTLRVPYLHVDSSTRCTLSDLKDEEEEIVSSNSALQSPTKRWREERREIRVEALKSGYINQMLYSRKCMSRESIEGRNSSMER